MGEWGVGKGLKVRIMWMMWFILEENGDFILSLSWFIIREEHIMATLEISLFTSSVSLRRKRPLLRVIFYLHLVSKKPKKNKNILSKSYPTRISAQSRKKRNLQVAWIRSIPDSTTRSTPLLSKQERLGSDQFYVFGIREWFSNWTHPDSHSKLAIVTPDYHRIIHYISSGIYTGLTEPPFTGRVSPHKHNLNWSPPLLYINCS